MEVKLPNVSRYVFVVPVFLSLTVFFFACTSAEPPKVVVPTPDISSAELFVMPADGGGFRARDLAEIEENLPFKVAFADPTYLPDETKLTMLNVFLPPDQVQGERRLKNTYAFLVTCPPKTGPESMGDNGPKERGHDAKEETYG